MSKTGRLLSVLAVVLVGVVVPAGARAAAWARTERGVRAFELVSPVDQQVLVRGSHVRLRLVLLPGASLKAVIVPGYRTARLTARLRSAEVPIGGGRRLIKAVVGGLPRGPSLLSFVTTLWGQTAGQQVVVNRVLPARVIAALGMVKVARGHAPVVRLLPSKLAVSVTAKLNGHDISQSFAQGALKFVQGLVPPGVRPAGDHRPGPGSRLRYADRQSHLEEARHLRIGDRQPQDGPDRCPKTKPGQGGPQLARLRSHAASDDHSAVHPQGRNHGPGDATHRGLSHPAPLGNAFRAKSR